CQTEVPFEVAPTEPQPEEVWSLGADPAANGCIGHDVERTAADQPDSSVDRGRVVREFDCEEVRANPEAASRADHDPPVDLRRVHGEGVAIAGRGRRRIHLDAAGDGPVLDLTDPVALELVDRRARRRRPAAWAGVL